MYKIYQIINIDGQRYVGSTKNNLNRRYSQHKANNKLKNPTGWTTAKQVMDRPHTILLIENTSKEQVKQRERFWIERLNNCVNHFRPYITEEEKVNEKRQWCKDSRKYQDSWGGQLRCYNNCLLRIDTNLFL
jgi:predicted GIY-YIG superfamily endonuclease